MTSDDSWIDHKDPVTPDDIRRLRQELIDGGADPKEVGEKLDAAIREAGSIEQMAKTWTLKNQIRNGVAAMRAARTRPVRKLY